MPHLILVVILTLILALTLVVYSATAFSSYWPTNIGAIRPVTPFLFTKLVLDSAGEAVKTTGCTRMHVVMACCLTLFVCGMTPCWDDDALYTNNTPKVEPNLLMNLPTRTF